MLAQDNRLRNKKDIDRVFKSGKGFREGFLLLKAFENGLNISRIGFVVSQKVAKKAVLRNKTKRRLRALIGSRIREMKRGFDLLFIALPGLAEKDFLSTKNSVNKLLIKARCFKNNLNH